MHVSKSLAFTHRSAKCPLCKGEGMNAYADGSWPSLPARSEQNSSTGRWKPALNVNSPTQPREHQPEWDFSSPLPLVPRVKTAPPLVLPYARSYPPSEADTHLAPGSSLHRGNAVRWPSRPGSLSCPFPVRPCPTVSSYREREHRDNLD